MENYTTNTELNVQADFAGAAPAAQYQPATASTVAGIALSSTVAPVPSVALFHEMDAALSEVSLKTAATDLAKRRAIWEEGAFKSSNAELFALLADCHALILHLLKFDEARHDFHNMYTLEGFESTKATSLTTKVVRYVFGESAKMRTFAYAKVLVVAQEANVAPENLPSFITANGGIEEIRRNGADAAAKREQREANIQKASTALKVCQPIATNVVAPTNVKVEGKTNFVAAIARKEADGTFSIVHVTANEGIVESLLANAAKDVVAADTKAAANSYADRRTALITE